MVSYRAESSASWKRLDPRALYVAVVESHWGGFALSRFLPTCFFSLVVVAKVSALAGRLHGGPANAELVPSSAYVLHQAAGIAFMALLVVLYAIRRPVVGRRSSLPAGVVALAGTFILNAAGLLRVNDGQTPMLLGASILVLAGTAFSIWSLLFLGRCFGIMPEARGLVTGGPYRWIRHPVYLGEIVSSLGLILPIVSIPVAGLFVVFCGLQYWRASMEERVLEEAFPEYGEYRQHTYRILPGIH